MKKYITILISLGFLCFCFDCLPCAVAEEHKDPGWISFTTINKYAESTTDFDEVDDTRNFTSEALFSQSRNRLNRPLTEGELEGIIRTKEQFESFNNLRLLPISPLAIDFSYKYRTIDDAQITNFFEPNQFNDVNVSEYGIAIQDSFNVKPYNFLVRGAYKRVNREGIIEFLPNSDEDIDQYEVNAVVSRGFDSNTAALYLTYAFQDIQLNIPNPYDRDRDIFATLVTYGQQKKEDLTVGLEKDVLPDSAIENLFERRFDTRGLRFFGGVVLDIETFGEVDVKKNDYFVGTSLSAWIDVTKWPEPFNNFDVSIEPGVFTSKVGGDPSQDNAQYRTNVTMYYQISTPLVLLIPLRHDIAIEGPDDFENWKAGIELRYTMGKCIFASLRYDYQRFFHLDKDLNLFGINLSLMF